MKIYLSIGEMAKACQVSIKTLRHYDRIDLFKPSYVNSQTGYRYYSSDQIYQMSMILLAKDLGLSLEQIRKMMTTGRVEVMVAFWQEQKLKAINQIEQLKKTIKQIDRLAGQILETKEINYQVPYEIKWFNKRSVIVFERQQANQSRDDIDIALWRLMNETPIKELGWQMRYGYLLEGQSFLQGNIVIKGSYNYLDQFALEGTEGVRIFPEGFYLCSIIRLAQPDLEKLQLVAKVITASQTIPITIIADDLLDSMVDWQNNYYEVQIYMGKESFSDGYN